MNQESEHITWLRDCIADVLREPTPYHISLLDAATKVVEARHYLKRHEKEMKRESQRGKLPPGYEPFRSEKPYEHGFVAPDGRRFGFWIDRATMRTAAWEHCEAPDEFEDPGEVEVEAQLHVYWIAESDYVIAATSDEALALWQKAIGFRGDTAVRELDDAHPLKSWITTEGTIGEVDEGAPVEMKAAAWANLFGKGLLCSGEAR